MVSACVKVAEEMAAVSEGGVGNGVGNVNMESVAGAKESKQPTRRKVIIDCDPGIGKKSLVVSFSSQLSSSSLLFVSFLFW